eukprot:12755-Heterococcus_DN1.PRE.1
MAARPVALGQDACARLQLWLKSMLRPQWTHWATSTSLARASVQAARTNSVNSAVTRAKVSRESACCACAPLYATPIAEVCTNLITALAAFSLPAVRTSAPCYQDTAGADVLCDSTYQYNGPQATCSNRACSCPLNSVLGQPVQEFDSAGKQFTSVKCFAAEGAYI